MTVPTSSPTARRSPSSSRSSAWRPTSSWAPPARCSAAAPRSSAPSPTRTPARSAWGCPARCRSSTSRRSSRPSASGWRCTATSRPGAASRARTTSTRTCRRTSRPPSTTSRSAPTATSTSSSTARRSGSRSSACTSRRTPARRCTSAARPAASTAPRTRWSTTTAPASRWSRSSPSRSRARGPGRPRSPRRTSPSCATCCAGSACATCAWSRARMRCDVNVSLNRPGERVGHPVGDQERQLAALGRAGGPRPRSSGRRPCCAPASGSSRRPATSHEATGHDAARALQGGGDRLPLLPGARPRAGRARPRVGASSCAAALPEPPSVRRAPAARRSWALSDLDARRWSTPGVLDLVLATVAGGRPGRRGAQLVARRRSRRPPTPAASSRPSWRSRPRRSPGWPRWSPTGTLTAGAGPAGRRRRARRRGRARTRWSRRAASRSCPTRARSARPSTRRIAAQPDVADKVRGGKVQAVGALVGAVMKATRGQADASVVRRLRAGAARRRGA